MSGRSKSVVAAILSSLIPGCVQPQMRPHSHSADSSVKAASFDPQTQSDLPLTIPITAPDAEPAPHSEFSEPVPVEALIHRALQENRTVQAAYHNVLSLRHRIPQVTALDDPFLSNTIFP